MAASIFAPTEEEIGQFLRSMTFGFLGTVDADGAPYVVPVNYVYREGKI